MSTHTKIEQSVVAWECAERDCEHRALGIEPCPSQVIDICKECSDRSWDEGEGTVIPWEDCQGVGEWTRERDEESVSTFWNGLPTPARRGTAVVADAPEFPGYWARGLIGERIQVVEVILDEVAYGGGIDYLDDRNGSGWLKVTDGRGGPRYGHSSLDIVPGSFEEAGA
jgi:hypothetical protein